MRRVTLTLAAVMVLTFATALPVASSGLADVPHDRRGDGDPARGLLPRVSVVARDADVRVVLGQRRGQRLRLRLEGHRQSRTPALAGPRGRRQHVDLPGKWLPGSG